MRVRLLANDVRAEARVADPVRVALGDSGVPYDWEHGDQAGTSKRGRFGVGRA